MFDEFDVFFFVFDLRVNKKERIKIKAIFDSDFFFLMECPCNCILSLTELEHNIRKVIKKVEAAQRQVSAPIAAFYL